MLNWFTNGLVYYGISFNTEVLGDPYLVFFYSAIAELLACISIQIFLEKFGSKWTYLVKMLISSVCLITTAFIPLDFSWVISLLVIIAKFCITATFHMLYIITSQAYPTSFRSRMNAVCAVFSSIGASIYPQVEKLVNFY